jgi:tRNA-2-methylthio-N6-dimethylallyladenosine synthase
LRKVHEVEGLERIRFLTSHPNWMTDELLETVAALPKVMPHIEVPVQAGDDKILETMKRGYTAEEYRRLVGRIRAIIPNVAIACDVIVGFPGESEAQYRATRDLLAELKLDVVHLARYSEREGTVAARRLADDVPEDEKMRRLHELDNMQEGIVAEINSRYLGETVKVLFEENVNGRWKGRTETNKLVFVQTERDLRGQVLPAQVTWTGPWSMQARLLPDRVTLPLPLESISVSA